MNDCCSVDSETPLRVPWNMLIDLYIYIYDELLIKFFEIILICLRWSALHCTSRPLAIEKMKVPLCGFACTLCWVEARPYIYICALNYWACPQVSIRTPSFNHVLTFVKLARSSIHIYIFIFKEKWHKIMTPCMVDWKYLICNFDCRSTIYPL